MKKEGWHRLSNIDTEARTATCSKCGFVRIKRLTDTNFACVVSRRYKNIKNHEQMPPIGSPCKICNKVKALVLDHCHDTNAFRGWLCRDCNLLLGYAKDDISILKNAAKYLELLNDNF